MEAMRKYSNKCVRLRHGETLLTEAGGRPALVVGQLAGPWARALQLAGYSRAAAQIRGAGEGAGCGGGTLTP